MRRGRMGGGRLIIAAVMVVVGLISYYSSKQKNPITGRTQEENSALGYLHGNCGHCHNPNSLGGVGLVFAQSAADPHGSAERTRASIGEGQAADIVRRLRSTNPYVRMPPVGVRVPDAHGADTVARRLDELAPRLRGGDDPTSPRLRGGDDPTSRRLRGGDDPTSPRLRGSHNQEKPQ